MPSSNNSELSLQKKIFFSLIVFVMFIFSLEIGARFITEPIATYNAFEYDRNRIAFIDLLPHIRKEIITSPSITKKEIRHRWFDLFIDSDHYSKEGHQFVADIILNDYGEIIP